MIAKLEKYSKELRIKADLLLECADCLRDISHKLNSSYVRHTKFYVLVLLRGLDQSYVHLKFCFSLKESRIIRYEFTTRTGAHVFKTYDDFIEFVEKL